MSIKNEKNIIHFVIVFLSQVLQNLIVNNATRKFSLNVSFLFRFSKYVTVFVEVYFDSRLTFLGKECRMT